MPSDLVSSSVIREFSDKSVEPAVCGFLHVPQNSRDRGLVLTHGAGGNARAPLLSALAEVFCTAGFTVLRCDLPYRQAHPWRPPGPGDAARDRAGLQNAAAVVRAQGVESVYMAGHSYGGRQSSMLCAEMPELVVGLLLLSYPLHPIRKPEQLRTKHLPSLRTPALFVHGTRDPFGTIAELEQAIKMIPARAKMVEVEGAGHDLGFKGKTRAAELPGIVFSEFEKFFS